MNPYRYAKRGLFFLMFLSLFSATASRADVEIGDTWCHDNPLTAFLGISGLFSDEDAKFFLSTFLEHLDETKKPKLELTRQGQEIISQWGARNPADQARSQAMKEQVTRAVAVEPELRDLFLKSGKFDGVAWQSTVSKCVLWLHMSGEITRADFEKIKAYLSKFQRKPYLRISLNSLGGEVEAAISIGRMIREHMGTVDMQGSCLSACVLVYASGIGKLMQAHMTLLPNQRSNIGVHHHFLASDALKSLSVQDSLAILQKTEDQIREYLREMGAGDELMTLAKSTLPEDVYFLNGEELRRLLPHVLGDYLSVIEMKTRESNFSDAKRLFELYLKSLDQSEDWRGRVRWLSSELHKITDFDEWRMGPMDQLRLARTLQHRYQ